MYKLILFFIEYSILLERYLSLISLMEFSSPGLIIFRTQLSFNYALTSATLCHLSIINTIECWRANDMCKRTTFTSFNTGIQTSFNDNDWTACLWKWILHWMFLNQFQLLFHYRTCLPEVVYLETTLWCNLVISIGT